MRTKRVSIIISMLLIATAVSAVESLKNNTINQTAPSTSLTSRAGGWTEIQKLLHSGSTLFHYFGYSVSLSGDTALIGVFGDHYYGAQSGSAYVFIRTGTTWAVQTELHASDGAADDRFGWSVSLSGDTALIGACNHDDNGQDSGSVYVFTRLGTSWTQQQKLLALDGAAGDRFGYSVSLSNDTALIGAVFDDDNGQDSGSAYVFTRSGTTWTQQQKLLALDGAADDRFGWSVSLSGDTALIGAPNHVDHGYSTGSAYVFTRTGTTWTQQQMLLASDGAAGDLFGVSASLDGDTAFIGAPFDDDVVLNSGSVYVFTRTSTSWTQQQKLLASDAAADQFGTSLSHSGNTTLIGVAGDDDNGDCSGSAYVFTYTGATWTEQQKLLASDGAATDCFGVSVSLDGDTALIGAPYNDDCEIDSGSAYIFIRRGENQPPTFGTPTPGNGSANNQISFTWSIPINDSEGDNFSWTIQCSNGQVNSGTGATNGTKSLSLSGLVNSTKYKVWVNATDPTGSGLYTQQWYTFRVGVMNWAEMQKLLASDGAGSDYFGYSVSLSDDTALIGAYGDDSGKGSAYVFVHSDTNWTFQQKLTASDGVSGDNFGISVSLQGDTALIGAYYDDDLGTNTGSAFVFTRSGTTWTQQQKLHASDGANVGFGVSVSLSGDTALIGRAGGKGSAYVFVHNDINWTFQQKLNASDGASGDRFGYSVSLDGDTALIGAPNHADHGYSTGSAYVFTRTGTTWTQQQMLLASDGAASDNFGITVSLSGDTALIGAYYDDDLGTNSGSAFVFTRSGTTWTQQQKLLASDGAASDVFGISVSLHGDTALIGAHGDNNYRGSGYVFTRSDTTWTQQQKLTASDAGSGDVFGISVSLHDDTALIGASLDDSQKGSAYLFRENQPPSPPTNPVPANSSTNVNITVSISWSACNDPDGDPITYDVYFGTTSLPPKMVSNQSETTYDPGTMNPNTHYYWKIIAWDNHGASASSPVWDFTTENRAPYVPSDPSPANGATSVSVIATMSWIGGDPDLGDIVTYDVYFGESLPLPKVSSNQSSSTYDPGTLNTNTLYYWQIVAWDNHSASTSGAVWQFTTENTPPYTPSDPSPATSATGVSISADLSWNGGDPDAGDAVTYDVYFGITNPPVILVSANQTGTLYDPGTMAYYTPYYWMIIAWDNHGATTGGQVWDFTTQALCGDTNNDGVINVGDVVYLINYLYKGGPEPQPILCSGDCNRDGVVNVGDVVYLINYLYKSGPAPGGCCA